MQWAFVEGDFSHLLPIYNFTSEELVEGFRHGYISITGYEYILFYFPYIIQQQKVFKHVSLGIWITVFIFLIYTIVSVSYFSEWQMENISFPVSKLFKAVEFSFFKRVDVFGVSLWMFLIIPTASISLWAAKKGLDSIHSNNKTYHLYIIAILIFIFISIPFSQASEKVIYYNTDYIGYGTLLWPNLLIIIHLIKIRKHGRGRLTTDA